MARNVSFSLEISSGNSDLADDPHGSTVRILRKIADKIENERPESATGKAYDLNGNAAGLWDFEIEEDEDSDEE